jgi:hypothetical protein
MPSGLLSLYLSVFCPRARGFSWVYTHKRRVKMSLSSARLRYEDNKTLSF